MSVARKRMVCGSIYQPRCVHDEEYDFSSTVAAYTKQVEEILKAWVREDATFDTIQDESEYAKKERQKLALRYVYQLFLHATHFRQL